MKGSRKALRKANQRCLQSMTPSLSAASSADIVVSTGEINAACVRRKVCLLGCSELLHPSDRFHGIVGMVLGCMHELHGVATLPPCISGSNAVRVCGVFLRDISF
jgi:hypothetical protein